MTGLASAENQFFIIWVHFIAFTVYILLSCVAESNYELYHMHQKLKMTARNLQKAV